MNRGRRIIAKHAALLVALAVIALAALVRLRLASVPLERDEGEYAYAGQLILKGIPPYLETYNMKFPGTYYAYALVMALFGQSTRAIRLGLLLVNAATALLIFAIARRLVDDLCAVAAAATFVLLSVDQWIMGIFAHATHFVLLPALGALLLSLHARDSRRMWLSFISGVLLGTAVLMKQHALFFVPLSAALVAWPAQRDRPRDWRSPSLRVVVLSIGAALPLAIIAGLFYWQGVLDKFWFWTVRYAKEYVSEVRVSDAESMLARGFSEIAHSTLFFWSSAGAGLVALLLDRWPALTRFFVAGLLTASFLAVCPGFYFRPHYFILLLPAVALLVGIGATSLVRLLARHRSFTASSTLTAALFAAIAATFVARESHYFFAMTPREFSRTRYGNNPFIEAVEIARYIKERTSERDRIMVVGSEPEIYFYADRPSASGYIYTYALMEPQPYASRMQHEMMQEIEAAHPKFLVFVDVFPSWLVRPESSTKIIDWSERYVRACYELVGIADIFPKSATRFVWEPEARQYRPTSGNVIYTYRTKSEGPCTVAW